MSLFGQLLMCMGLFVSIEGGAHWSYEGEHGKNHWSEMFDVCGQGMKQSPINLEVSDAVYKDALTDIHLVHKADPTADKMFIFNNGHTVQLKVDANFVVRGGSLGGAYKVAQVHFHWGKTDYRGSEHQKNGEAYPLEMHIVTYDTEKYNNLGEAVGKDGGIAVIGVFFKVDQFHNKNLDPILSNIDSILQPDSSKLVPVEMIDLQSLLPIHSKYYFRYEGSLTTPGCSETVIWTVMDMPQFITAAQLAKFRQLLEKPGVNLVDNYRDVQPLNSRTVWRSFPKAVEYVVIRDAQINADVQDISAASHNQLGVALAMTAAATYWLMC